MNVLIFQRQSVLLVPPPPLGCSFRDEKSLSKHLLPFHPCSFLIGDGSVVEDLRKGTELEIPHASISSLANYCNTGSSSRLNSLLSVDYIEVFL